ncbi:hypothetical protein V5O48_012027 [Marasmius crinis-equi]|uniref:Protein-S-isoprenylcysteine O-methyltransferase n=1 Tax=Marasmius crinis-equi TaxID=585013 RepID=A0ABR3F3X2_9AGAR
MHPLTAPRVLALLFSISGCVLRMTCHRMLGTAFTWHVSGHGESSSSKLKEKRSPKLITTGPYSYVRHPSYAGYIPAWSGLAAYYLLPGSWMREPGGFLSTGAGQAAIGFWIGGWVVLTTLVVIMRMAIEDETLRKQFGQEWEKWRERVRWKIIPLVW